MIIETIVTYTLKILKVIVYLVGGLSLFFAVGLLIKILLIDPIKSRFKKIDKEILEEDPFNENGE